MSRCKLTRFHTANAFVSFPGIIIQATNRGESSLSVDILAEVGGSRREAGRGPGKPSCDMGPWMIGSFARPSVSEWSVLQSSRHSPSKLPQGCFVLLPQPFPSLLGPWITPTGELENRISESSFLGDAGGLAQIEGRWQVECPLASGVRGKGVLAYPWCLLGWRPGSQAAASGVCRWACFMKKEGGSGRAERWAISSPSSVLSPGWIATRKGLERGVFSRLCHT